MNHSSPARFLAARLILRRQQAAIAFRDQWGISDLDDLIGDLQPKENMA